MKLILVGIGALFIGFVFATGIFYLFGPIGLGIYLFLYFFFFLPWFKKIDLDN